MMVMMNFGAKRNILVAILMMAINISPGSSRFGDVLRVTRSTTMIPTNQSTDTPMIDLKSTTRMTTTTNPTTMVPSTTMTPVPQITNNQLDDLRKFILSLNRQREDETLTNKVETESPFIKKLEPTEIPLVIKEVTTTTQAPTTTTIQRFRRPLYRKKIVKVNKIPVEEQIIRDDLFTVTAVTEAPASMVTIMTTSTPTTTQKPEIVTEPSTIRTEAPTTIMTTPTPTTTTTTTTVRPPPTTRVYRKKVKETAIRKINDEKKIQDEKRKSRLSSLEKTCLLPCVIDADETCQCSNGKENFIPKISSSRNNKPQYGARVRPNTITTTTGSSSTDGTFPINTNNIVEKKKKKIIPVNSIVRRPPTTIITTTITPAPITTASKAPTRRPSSSSSLSRSRTIRPKKQKVNKKQQQISLSMEHCQDVICVSPCYIFRTSLDECPECSCPELSNRDRIKFLATTSFEPTFNRSRLYS